MIANGIWIFILAIGFHFYGSPHEPFTCMQPSPLKGDYSDYRGKTECFQLQNNVVFCLQFLHLYADNSLKEIIEVVHVFQFVCHCAEYFLTLFAQFAFVW